MKALFIAMVFLGSTLMISGLVIAEDIIDLPPSGTDISSIRCGGRIVSIGAQIRQVQEMCSEPLNKGQMPNRTYDVWVYQFENSKFVHYLAFRNRRLERIYQVNCIKGDAHCP